MSSDDEQDEADTETNVEGENAHVQENTSRTPLSHLKSQLKAIRRKSLHRQAVVQGTDSSSISTNRRATLGFGESLDAAVPRTPENPAQRIAKARPHHTVARGNAHATNTAAQTSPTPMDQGESSQDTGETDKSGNFEVNATSADRLDDQSTQSATRSMEALRIHQEPATPDFRGVKEMLNPKHDVQTPRFTGLREMYAQALEMQTPQLSGVRDLFARPSDARSLQTPDMSGLKHMMSENRGPAGTPDLSGLTDVLYAADDTGEADQVQEVVDGSAPEASETNSSHSAIRTRRKAGQTGQEKLAGSTSSTASKSSEKAISGQKTTRVVRTRPTSVETEVKPSRTRVAPSRTTTATAAPTRATRTAVPVPAPARTTRARAGAKPATGHAEAQSDPLDTIKASPSDDEEEAGRTTRVTRAAAPTKSVAKRRTAGPLKTTTSPPQVPEKSRVKSEAEPPKVRATRARVGGVKVEDQEDVKPPASASTAPPRRTRSAATSGGLTAPTAASRARAATTAAAKKAPTAAPVTRTKATATTTDEPAAPVKRVTRARKA